VNPIDYVRVRVIKNKNDRYSISKKNVSENLSWTEQKNHDEFVFSSTNVEPYEIEETTPPWHMGYPAIFISAFASHQEVSVWALEIFKLEETSKKTVSDLAKEITRDKSSKKSKIDTIIRWVQNEIRYMGIESGIGAILPFQPIETIQQRFGDCKDKTLLLTALLNEIGIEAYPLLVNTSLLHEVATLPPAAQLFDHVIVYFEYQGEVYTVDATMPFQGGSLGKRAVYGYSNGLLVKKNEGIINIDYDPNKSKTETREVFEMDDFESPCSLTVITKLTGFNADQMRMIFDMFSSRELSKELMSVYSVLYDVSLLEKLEVTDDIENNIVTLVEQYQINSFFEKKEVAGEEVHLLHYEPVGLYQYISSLSCEPKLHPVYVPFPSNYYQKTNIILPEGLITPPENTVIENDVFEYIYKQEVKNMYDLVLEYSFSTISNEIQNSSFNRVCRDMNQIVQSLPLSLSYPVEP
ncbi:MAG: transglutaminase-like domain-containing protein, partial [Bacteroidota bacterium]